MNSYCYSQTKINDSNHTMDMALRNSIEKSMYKNGDPVLSAHIPLSIRMSPILLGLGRLACGLTILVNALRVSPSISHALAV
jgi:hypothetical protein